jgi:hypothetical protein
MIEYNKLFFQTYDAFEAVKDQIDDSAIVFIKDRRLIYTHKTFFNAGNTQNDDIKHVILTQSAYDALEAYDNNTIYFIITSDTTPDEEWVLGDALPLTLCAEHTELGQALPIVLSEVLD